MPKARNRSNIVFAKDYPSRIAWHDSLDVYRDLVVVLTPEAGSVIADLEASQEDALADRLAGFTPEERKEYLAFSQRITENLQRCLQS